VLLPPGEPTRGEGGGSVESEIVAKAEWERNFEQLLVFFETQRTALPADWMSSALLRRKGTQPPPKGASQKPCISKKQRPVTPQKCPTSPQQRPVSPQRSPISPYQCPTSL